MPMNVRLAEDTRRRIQFLSRRCGITASDLVRQAITQKLPEWERAGVITLFIPRATDLVKGESN